MAIHEVLESVVVSAKIRVRTILALGYWVMGNICRYWVVLLLGDIFLFFHCDTQYDTNQTAVHMITILTSVVRPLSADDVRESGDGDRVQAICHHHRVLRFYLVMLYILRFNINTLLCYTVVSVLILSIGIARGQYYWILDIGCPVWYRSNPSQDA